MTIGDGGSAAPPGWYPDGPGWERRWDGVAWTADRRPVSPAQPPVQPPAQPPAQPPTQRPVQASRSPWAPPSAGAPAGSPAPSPFRPASPPPGQVPPGSPQGPPPGPPFATPGGPSYPAPPQKKSLLWLWVALAVVLIVVVATVVTLVVVQPWSDDGDGSKGGGATTEPTETEPAAEPVRGDIDGDGRGDVLGRFYDSTESRLTLTNADGSFQLAKEPVQQEENLVVADFDGEGGNDVGSWFDSGGTLQFEIEDSDLSVTQAFDLWFKVEAVNAAFGDFDGDGLTDIAAYGQQHRSQVAVWVLRNSGDGFEAPVKWAALPNATYGSTELIVGDFNGDGSDDVMAVAPDEPVVRGDFDNLYWYGDFGVVPLIARAGSFARGTIAPVETDLFDQEYTVGDFDGDGKETLVADNFYEDTFLLYEYDGTTLRPTGATVPYGVAGDGVMDAVTAVDLNGDQLDDLVLTSVNIDDYSFYGVWVATADAEGGIDTPTKWADLPSCSNDYCEVDYFVAR
ncbi:FG-GAP-like repeat-containing protein [Nocardioides bizhenqiangii]|uniref:FG-GAP-like repeat-containing protein n=1 Tax=Nocardioides bizhenqiangii TaxID=3095076 RepID=A0ABZ0ZSS7_9ACTN|nr:FG-GAP-like repeat-containing protein [Nocardioides sp. HM61]WQQ27337.1 FG-GAP-like repeat-containing protein [Nocardioides sp. HM61]